jgi:hypothetical protein
MKEKIKRPINKVNKKQAQIKVNIFNFVKKKKKKPSFWLVE